MNGWHYAGGTLVSACMLYYILTRLRRSLSHVVDLQSKVVLITGASSGLGEACAREFYKHGCRLILAGRNRDRLEAVKKSLLGIPANVQETHPPVVLTLDLEDLASIPRKALEAEACFGQVDIVLNNAGVSYRGCVEGTSVEVYQRLMTINFFGHAALINALLPAMTSRGTGHIVGISSVQGKISIPFRSAYSASKHALQAFFDCLRAELAETKIGVCLVSPGYIRTNLSTNAICGDGTTHGAMDKSTASGMPPETVADAVVQSVVRGDPDVVIAPLHHRLVVVLRAVMPNLFFYIMAKRAARQRKEFLKKD